MNTVAKNSVLQFIQNKRNLFWIFLLLNTLAWAQPTIVNPTPYQVCDDNNDGFAGFELFTKDAEILGTNAPNDYRVTYHTILADAQNDVNEIFSTYTNTVAYNQTVYVRVEENANPSNFATTTLDLIVHDKPIAGNPGDYLLCEQTMGSNTAVFNLTSLNTVIVNGNVMPPHQISFYTTQADAIPGSTINLIGTPATHTVTGTQTIWALLENTVTGCYNVRAVNLIVEPLPVIPASGFYPAFETCDTGAPVGIETFDLTTAIPTILNGQSGISVTFYPSLSDAQNNFNAIANPAAYTNPVAYTQTLGVVLTNVTTGCKSYATIDLIINNSAGVISGTQYLCNTVTTSQLSSTVSGGVWSSSDTNIATVDATGLVTGVSAGNVTISYSVGTGICETTSIMIYSGSCPSINAQNDINITYLNTPVSGSVTTNDSAVEPGEILTVTPYAGPTAGGTLVMQSDGAYVYTPQAGWTGTTTYTYTVCDNGFPEVCTTAVLTIEVLPYPILGINSGVTANNDTATTEGTNPVTINVLSNDFDEDGDNFTIIPGTVSTPNCGTVASVGTTIVFTPDATCNGIDEAVFTYEICDDGTPQACDTATVTVTINPTNTTNDVVANDDAANTNKDTPVTGNVLANDTDPENGTFTVTANTPPSNGTVVIDPVTGVYTYTPNAGYTGPDSFTYTICDDQTPQACDTATVYITVNPSTLNGGLILMKDGFLDMNIVAPNTFANIGDIINYTFTVTNTGNTTVNNITISDAMLGLSNLVVSPSTLASGQSATATATYAITQVDIDTGFVYNQASVSGVDSNSALVTSQSTDPTPCYTCPNPNQIQDITIVPLNNMVNEGNTNTISGFINYDNGGCSTTNSPAAFMPILVQSTTQQFYTYTNADGSYTINVPQGNYTITPQLQWNQPGFVVNPINTTVNFATNTYLTATQNFCISVASPISDVEVAAYVGNSLRPGFNSDVYIYYRNKGNQVMSGDITFNFDASRMDFNSANPSTTVSSGVASWSYANLVPGELRIVYLNLRTHSPTDTLPVNIGNVLPFSVSITPSTDAISNDNSMTFTSMVVGSYDPNNIICTEGDVLPTSEIGDFLHYTVNFENTGNYPADFVNVRIPIDVNLYDVNTLEIEGTSHYFQPKL